jgi:hypothetical protein
LSGERREPEGASVASGVRAASRQRSGFRFSEIAQRSFAAGVADDGKNLTTNPFPSGKENRIYESNLFPSGKGNRITESNPFEREGTESDR